MYYFFSLSNKFPFISQPEDKSNAIIQTEKIKQLESDLKQARTRAERLIVENLDLQQKQQSKQELIRIKPTPLPSIQKTPELVDNKKKPKPSPTVVEKKLKIPEVFASITKMGNGKAQEFSIDKQVSKVAVNLPLRQSNYTNFRVELRSTPPWEQKTKQIINREKKGTSVRIIIQAKFLNDGNNTLFLYGIDKQGYPNLYKVIF